MAGDAALESACRLVELGRGVDDVLPDRGRLVAAALVDEELGAGRLLEGAQAAKDGRVAEPSARAA
jgi:hypothetical protein